MSNSNESKRPDQKSIDPEINNLFNEHTNPARAEFFNFGRKVLEGLGASSYSTRLVSAVYTLENIHDSSKEALINKSEIQMVIAAISRIKRDAVNNEIDIKTEISTLHLYLENVARAVDDERDEYSLDELDYLNRLVLELQETQKFI